MFLLLAVTVSSLRRLISMHMISVRHPLSWLHNQVQVGVCRQKHECRHGNAHTWWSSATRLRVRTLFSACDCLVLIQYLSLFQLQFRLSGKCRCFFVAIQFYLADPVRSQESLAGTPALGGYFFVRGRDTDPQRMLKVFLSLRNEIWIFVRIRQMGQ